MSDTFKFPNDGYEVSICRKSDIIKCIDDNIIDKELALAIIDHLEFQAAEYINGGRWTSLPFIGNVRVPKEKQLLQTDEMQTLINDAGKNLTKEQYCIFRHRLAKENEETVRQHRYYRYITSIAVKKNRKLYKILCDTKGEAYARFVIFASYNVVAVNNEYIISNNL